jgi:hypothetical protein
MSVCVQICGGVQSASFRSDEIDQMLIDFVFALRRHRRYQGAAFVVAIEGNMSYIEADRIASIVQKSQVQPVVVLAEDGQQKGRYGVHTGHMEKSAYIEVIQALMVRGGLYWAEPCDFVGRYNRGAEQLSGSILAAQRTEFQSTMYGEMMNYRSERRDPKVRCHRCHHHRCIRRSAGAQPRLQSLARARARRTTRSCHCKSQSTGHSTRSQRTSSWISANGTAGGVAETSCRFALPSAFPQRQIQNAAAAPLSKCDVDMYGGMQPFNLFLEINCVSCPRPRSWPQSVLTVSKPALKL